MSKYDARLKEWYERTNGGKLDEVSDTKLQIVEHGVGAKQEEDGTDCYHPARHSDIHR
jgi:tetracycline resistance efflux pump